MEEEFAWCANSSFDTNAAPNEPELLSEIDQSTTASTDPTKGEDLDRMKPSFSTTKEVSEDSLRVAPSQEQITAVIELFAEAARQTSSPETSYLSDPPVVQRVFTQRHSPPVFDSFAGEFELLYATDITLIARWGFFNPYGPTVDVLALVDVPGRSEQLLCSYMLNPFAATVVIYGLVPQGNRDALSRAAERLFIENGTLNDPFIPNLPTHMMVLPESPISPDEIEKLMFAASQKATPEDLDEVCDRYELFMGKPWERVTFERDLAGGDLVALAKQPESIVKAALERALRPPSTPPPPTYTQFNRWWDLVTDPKHFGPEALNLGKAWKGSIDFGGIFDPEDHHGLRWGDVVEFLNRAW